MTILSHDDIASLSPAQRLALIGELWDSLTDADVALPPAQLAEIDRRLETFDDDVKHAISWDQFKAKLAKREL